jgi:hypothetical protein
MDLTSWSFSNPQFREVYLSESHKLLTFATKFSSKISIFMYNLYNTRYKRATFNFGARCWWRSCLRHFAKSRKVGIQFPMVSLKFFIDIIPPAALCPWG